MDAPTADEIIREAERAAVREMEFSIVRLRSEAQRFRRLAKAKKNADVAELFEAEGEVNYRASMLLLRLRDVLFASTADTVAEASGENAPGPQNTETLIAGTLSDA